MKNLCYFLLPLLAIAGCSTQPNPEVNIPYEKMTLANGLDVILHEDHSDPIVAYAIQFHVGSGRESEGRTGFAHLFEHFMFSRSENVALGQFDEIIQDAGGMSNAGTGNDATTYFEVVSKNALEKVFWLESDRLGFLTNAINKKALNIQQNVVQNEKRQYEDNAPYGFTEWTLAKNLYPKGHPYSWTVIGEMADLLNATVEDAKTFHDKFYVPNNATMVLSGDFDPVIAKQLIEKYFGEIKKGADIKDPEPMPVVLTGIKRLVHEDNFARAGQLTMAWPTVEQYHPDSYALDYLAQLLSRGKKAPMYKVIEKEKKLASGPRADNSSQEVAGSFAVTITANEGIQLQDVEAAVFESFSRFESDGFTDADVERIKAGLETRFYNGISSVLGKSFQLAQYNEYAGSPDYYKTDLEKMKGVTRADILRVYKTYIKGKPFVETSFVPKGKPEISVSGSLPAGVIEEDILTATEVKIDEAADEPIVKTPTGFDRTVVPADGPEPVVTIPAVWSEKLSNGMGVWGIEQNELPLVQFSIVIKGGHYLDQPEKPGVGSLMASLMNQGTKNRSPQELEEAIESLGARININGGASSISVSANCLVRNFDATLKLVEEMLLEPRWDAEEFALAQNRVINNLKRQKSNPNALASELFNEKVYGSGHIFAVSSNGTLESVSAITLDDLREFYAANLTPSLANFHIAGQIGKGKVVESLKGLVSKWPAKEVVFPVYPVPEPLQKSEIIVVDVPGAKQSVIRIGSLALAQSDPDYFAATVMNDHLGGNFLSLVNQVLREQKGFTYGAGTSFSGSYIPGPFTASSMVRSSATLESLQIFKSLMESYRNGIPEEDLAKTRSYLVKSYAQNFETLGALTSMLADISMYNLPVDYVKGEQETIRNMTVDQHKALAQKYIDPSRMYYVIAGDAATQAAQLKALGFGEPAIIRK
ncbi:MAG TPA: peptidase M16 [Bacteroidales bacterium]|nr:peptidase M16 [Bacteroidales bacterium]